MTSDQQRIERMADEIARLREVLQKIASCRTIYPGDIVDIARSALSTNQGTGE